MMPSGGDCGLCGCVINKELPFCFIREPTGEIFAAYFLNGTKASVAKSLRVYRMGLFVINRP